jgi:hypothetical protein
MTKIKMYELPDLPTFVDIFTQWDSLTTEQQDRFTSCAIARFPHYRSNHGLIYYVYLVFTGRNDIIDRIIYDIV